MMPFIPQKTPYDKPVMIAAIIICAILMLVYFVVDGVHKPTSAESASPQTAPPTTTTAQQAPR